MCLPLVPHIYVGKLGQHWFRLMVCRLIPAKPLPEPILPYSACMYAKLDRLSENRPIF